MQSKTFSTELGGKKFEAIFSNLADQAHGSVIVRYGETAVMATAVMSAQEKKGDFFPLTVDFEERFYAGGKIAGSRFVRREGRPSDAAILSGRIIDRTIRPLFDGRIRNEVQVVMTVLALGTEDVNVASVLAASLALSTSDIPWNGPVSAARVAIKKGTGDLVVNPTYVEKEGELTFDLLACGKDGMINMIEVGSDEVLESVITAGLTKASEIIETLQKFQNEIIKEIGKVKRAVTIKEISADVVELFKTEIEPKMFEYVFSTTPGKARMGELAVLWDTLVAEKLPDADGGLAAAYLDNKINDIIHKEAIENGRRADGRGIDELRPLFARVGGISSMLHGTGIFYRGGTHILSVATLGGPQDAQLIDGMEGEEIRRYMHHYNFPPFSTGETGRIGGTNRRMIGHGALAEKALVPVLPSKEEFPYVIRVVSEAFASNGSTSMGSVCGSTLSLMDAGVPIKKPVAGIASGLMMETVDGKLKYKVLTDIQGPEDHHGDMDFKVAGTRDGVTAMQMDVKVEGVPVYVLTEALEKAKAARFKILDVMTEAIRAPREAISPHAPQIVSIKIKPDQIGLVIGGGGKTVNEIREKTGTEIDIEDDGTVFITGKNGSADKARAIIEEMTREYKMGDTFTGEVVRIVDFGAFVKISSRADGLVHISEIAPWRVEKVTDYLTIGDKIPVIVKEVDALGRISLSIKRVAPEQFKDKRPATVVETPKPETK
jgi:polyribonucleotide nucleotidyltransferase